MFDNLQKFAAVYAVAIGGILRTCLSLWNVRQELQTSHYYLSVHRPEGHVTLVGPTGTRLEVARAYAVTRLVWIRSQQAKLQAQARETPREYIERESHHSWGGAICCPSSRRTRGPR
jgi:predicted metal-dependent hydrolase